MVYMASEGWGTFSQTRMLKVVRFTLVGLCLLSGLFQQIPVEASDKGKIIYQFCAACHGDRGEGIEILSSPRIDIQPIWYNKRQLENYKNNIRGFCKRDLFGVQMRVMMLYLNSDKDLEETVNYIDTFKPINSPDKGNNNIDVRHETFMLCQGCHGPGARGMESLGGPPLAGQDGWYLRQQLQLFKSGYRGTQKGDKGGQIMQPIALSLEDESAIDDIVDYITKQVSR